MNAHDNPFKLTPEENKAYFEHKIIPELTAGSNAVEQPIFVLIGGQSGAGKSRLTAEIKNSLGNNAIVLDADLFRPKHPHYINMIKVAPLKVLELARDDVNKWITHAWAFAMANKRNVIMDGTLRDTDDIAKRLEFCQRIDYKAELNIVATHERNSHTSIFERYEEGIASIGTGRYVDPDFHKAAYEAIPKTVQYVEEHKLVDSIRICNRDNGTVYENTLVAGQWEKEPKAVEALVKERDREPTQKEIQWLEKQRANTLALMEKRGASEQEKDYVKKQFQSNPIPLLGKPTPGLEKEGKTSGIAKPKGMSR